MVDYYNAYQRPPYYKPGYDHTQQEEEWDPGALLDPTWERQQKKTFTAWCNSHLRKAGTGIEILEEDFQSGLKLMLLLEVISGEPLPRPDRGKMRFHKIANVAKALSYIESKGVKLVSIAPEAIVDGNVKMTLGLIWTIILRFAIQEINVGELSARDGLLLWCQRKTAPYDNVDIQNFSTSWKDGLGFCALIHRHRPDLIDYHKLGSHDPVSNLNTAFDVAEKHLDIPRMLDAEVLASSVVPDEKAIMTYVSCYYHHFLGKQEAETAANRISRALKTNQENEQLMADYENLASDLLSWVGRWKPWLSNRPEDDTLDDTRKKMDDFRIYRRREKPPRIEEKGKLETLFNTLQTKLRLSNRPPFLPKDGHLIKDINSAWQDLERSEKGFEEWLLPEMMRLERLENIAEKFRRKCALHEEWISGKENILRSTDYKSCDVYNVKALRKRHEAFESDLGAHQERVEQIAAIAKELNRLNYPKIGPINQLCQSICEQWDRIGELTNSRRIKLEEMERIAEELDNLHLTLAKKAAPFNNWLDSVKEDLSDLVIVHDMAEIKELVEAHNEFKSTLTDAEKGFQSILELEQQIISLAQRHDLGRELLKNPYTDLTTPELNRKWREVQDLVPRRDGQLQDEQTKQQNNDRLRQSFAEKANSVGPWLERQLENVLSIGMGGRGSLESSINQLRGAQQNALGYKPRLDELERINQEMQENLVFETPGSRYSMESLRVGWESLMTSINRVINECENQILLRDGKGIREDQLNEYRASFNHFDKDRKGLDEEQLRACLISIGYNARAGKEGDLDMKRIMASIDPNRMGRVPFDAFLDFMTRETADSDTAEQMADSFRILANGNPHITAEELRRELPPDQADYCIRRLERFRDSQTGAYDYTSFSRSLYSH